MPSKKKAADDDVGTVNAAQDEDLLEDAVKGDESGLDIMLEIIMMIREDDNFAKSIYANCPRLQHLLDKNPDLRPLFEEPKFVRLNFEQVYRNAGGVLPEDKPSLLSRILKCIVTHPLFKVLRLLLIVKKVYTCIMGGGISFIRSCLCNFLTDDALDNADLLDGDEHDANRNGGGYDDDNDGRSPEQEANRRALYDAADRMEEPDVQDKMQKVLNSDPDKLGEMIEADPELRALRDSNPLCAELMQDQQTMRILTEPDNLRAFADSPSLVEQDFSNPNWSPPDVEGGEYDDGGRMGLSAPDEQNNGMFDDYEVGETDQGDGGMFDDFERGEVELDEDGGVFDDFERGEVDLDDDVGVLGEGEFDLDDVDEEGFLDEFETGENEGPYDLNEQEGGDEGQQTRDDSGAHDVDDSIGGEDGDDFEQEAEARKRSASKKNKRSGDDEEGGEGEAGRGGGGGGFLGSLGAGLVDYVAAETIGVSASAMFGGGEEDELAGAVEEAGGDLEQQANSAENLAMQAAAVAEIATGDDVAGNLEDTLDTVEEAHDTHEAAPRGAPARQTGAAPQAASNVPVAAAAGAGVMSVGSRFFSSLNTAAKEYVAANILGDDVGEALVERLEEGGDDDEEGDDDNDDRTSKTPQSSAKQRRTRGSGHDPVEF